MTSRIYFFPFARLPAFAQYSLSVSSTGWLVLRSTAAVSQSVSRTNAPALFASGLHSSAMQQQQQHTLPTHTNTLSHTHTHSPSPLSISLWSSAEFTYLPAYSTLAGESRECQTESVSKRRGGGGGGDGVCVWGGADYGGCGGHRQCSLICRGRWRVEGRVQDTQRSCIPIDTEEGFVLQPCKDGKERERKRERDIHTHTHTECIIFQRCWVSMWMWCICW